MTGNPVSNLNPSAVPFRQADDPPSALRIFYHELCHLDTLRSAYEQIKGDPQNYGVDTGVLETVEGKNLGDSLQQLSSDLQVRTYHPSQAAESGVQIDIRNTAVQVALKRLLQSAFPPAFPSEPGVEKSVKWLVANIDAGLYRAYFLLHSEERTCGEGFRGEQWRIVPMFDESNSEHFSAKRQDYDFSSDCRQPGRNSARRVPLNTLCQQ